MTSLAGGLPVDDLRALARRYRLPGSDVFGSVARGEAGQDSALDMLYVAGPSTLSGLAFYDLATELEQLLARQVSLVPKEHLHWVVRDRVLAEAQVVYAATT